MNRTVSIYRLLLTCSITASLAFGSLSAKNSIGEPGPIDPGKPLDPLTCLNVGDTAAISLMQYHSYAAPESRSSKEISIKDTCVVHFDFKKFSITGNREIEVTTNNIAASVVVKKSNNGIFEDYQKFKLRLNANPDGTYTIADSHRHSSFLAYPCLYKVVYEGIVDDKDHWIGDDKDISIDPIPSDSIFITPIMPANSEASLHIPQFTFRQSAMRPTPTFSYTKPLHQR